MSRDFIDKHSIKGNAWYISKYLVPPIDEGIASRGFYLMRELVNNGYSVTIFSSDSNHFIKPPQLRERFLLQEFEGVSWVWVRTTKYNSVRSFKRILSWIHFEIGLLKLPFSRFSKPDVIVASSLSLLSVISGIFLSWRFKARFVFEVRDIWPLTLTEEGGFSTKSPFIKLLSWIENLGYTKADAIVGTMPNLIDHVRSVSNSQKPVYCIPMGYEESSLIKTADLPSEYLASKVPDGKFVLGYAGSIGTTNALETFFQCAELLRENDQIHFVLVGTGDLFPYFKEKYGSLQNITFVGKIPKAYVQKVLEQFDALYLSTFSSRVWDYGQSLNKVIDYMLAGKPIIASYSGFPSMLNEAESGFFVPAGDKEALLKEIIRVSKMNPVELKNLGETGRTWLLEHRSYPKLASDYLEVLFPST